MALLPFRPMKHRALQLDAARYWESNGSTLVDAVTGEALPASGTFAPGADPARTWTDDELWFQPGAHFSAGIPLGDNFCVFFRLSSKAELAAVQRSVIRVLVDETNQVGFAWTSDSDSLESTVWGASPQTSGVFSRYQASGEGEPHPPFYGAIFTQGNQVFLTGGCPGDALSADRLQGRDGEGNQVWLTASQARIVSIGGDGSVPVLGGSADASANTSNNSFGISTLFALDRDSSIAEISRWTRLLETGRYSDGLLFPVNNSEGVIAAAISDADTVLTVDGGTAYFVAPGPAEESRVTLVDPKDPSKYEVCALTGNYGGQLEVRRGEEATAPRAWPAGTLVKGMLTGALFEPAALSVIPSLIPPPDSGVAMGADQSLSQAQDGVYIGRAVSATNAGYSVLVGSGATATDADGLVLVGDGAYADNVNDSVVLGTSAYAANIKGAVVIGDGAYAEASDRATVIGNGSYCEMSERSLALGRGSYLNESPRTLVLGRGRTVAGLPGMLVSPGPAVLPNPASYNSGFASLPEHAKRTTFESVLFSEQVSLAAGTLSIALPAGVRVFIDEIGLLVVTGGGVFDGMSLSVTNELSESLVASTPLVGTIDTNVRWRTKDLALDKGANTVNLVIESAPASGGGIAQLYVRGFLVQTELPAI